MSRRNWILLGIACIILAILAIVFQRLAPEDSWKNPNVWQQLVILCLSVDTILIGIWAGIKAAGQVRD